MNGIWIRSQDRKKLVLASELSVEQDMGRDGFGQYSIPLNSWHVCAGRTLGSYPTEARALEVMDEIQKFKQGTLDAKPGATDSRGCVRYNSEVDTYQMPPQ
jgi:hypothetical protein